MNFSRMIKGSGVLAAVVAVGLASAQSPNFYLPAEPSQSETSEKSKEAKESKEAVKKPASSASSPSENKSAPKAPAKKTPTSTPAPSPKPSPTPKPTPTPTPKPEPTPKPTPAPVPRRTTQPLDPTRLGAMINFRQDFFNLHATLKEEANIRRATARAKVARLSRAFTRVANGVEKRQRNLHNAVAAYYVIARDQNSWSPLGGSTLTAAPYIALQNSIRKDSLTVREGLKGYENIRTGLSLATEELEAFEKETTATIISRIIAEYQGVSMPVGYVAEEQTKRLLEERLLPDYADESVVAAENAAGQYEKRETLAGFAPPPPLEDVSGGEMHYTPLPQNDLPVAGSTAPSLTQPASFYYIKPVPVNAPLIAPQKGNVVFAGPVRGYGDMVILEHDNNLFSVYGHLGTLGVKERETVEAKQVIGRAGFIPSLRRPGLHYHVRKGSAQITTATLIQSDRDIVGD